MTISKLLDDIAVVVEFDERAGWCAMDPRVRQRKEFLVGRQCAREALARLGSAQPLVRVGPGGEPIWPMGVVGSITHSRGHVAVAVANRATLAGIGIDVEHSSRPAEPLAPLLCSERERRRLIADGASWRVVFSAKESVRKLVSTTTGHIPPARSFELDLGPDGAFGASDASGAPPLGALDRVQGRWHLDGEAALTAAWIPAGN